MTLSDFPYLLLEDIIKNNWTLPEVTTAEIDWGYYPLAQGQQKAYCIKCEDNSDQSVDHFGIPLSHMNVNNRIGIIIGVRNVDSDGRTRPPAEYFLIVNHIKSILKANRFPVSGGIHEYRLAEGSRELESRMIARGSWFIYYIPVDAYYFD